MGVNQGFTSVAGRMRQRLLLRCSRALACGVLMGAVFDVAAQCADFSVGRRAYFGDVHVHTSYSQDANWRMGTTQTTPDDAYRFARGARISLPPYDAAGQSLRSVQLQRPLDFAAVTDHGESQGDVRICADPDYVGPGAWMCRKGPLVQLAVHFASRYLPIETLCAPGDAGCAVATLAVWEETIGAARSHNAECDFTTFIGYEWSGMDGPSNLHRNVIFSGDAVIAQPISELQARSPEALWDALDEQCRDAGTGCEAITIPHNANLSDGKMFAPTTTAGEAMSPTVAEQRQRYERLVELIQHKGDSECYYGAGIGIDELCNFEKLPYSNFLQKYVSVLGEPPANDGRYVREGLREGLRLERALGINPFVPGFIGGTDTHISAPGAVDERDYTGNHGAQHITGQGDLPQFPDLIEQNPGGLAVLYAEQNTRESLFAAMQRREAYATSGPRIGLRFFGGWELPPDLCEQVDLVPQGYQRGVPMGGVLPEASAAAPAFVITAVADAGTPTSPGTALQHMQVIKNWVDDNGQSQEAIFEVAGNADNGADVDLASCEPRGQGAEQLCAVWRDPAFDPAQSAFYYARVLENPSCRWQQHICARNKVDCSAPEAVPAELASCCDAATPKTIQERAWSSPIWYRSPASANRGGLD
jgi:hypothetical protein